MRKIIGVGGRCVKYEYGAVTEQYWQDTSGLSTGTIIPTGDKSREELAKSYWQGTNRQMHRHNHTDWGQIDRRTGKIILTGDKSTEELAQSYWLGTNRQMQRHNHTDWGQIDRRTGKILLTGDKSTEELAQSYWQGTDRQMHRHSHADWGKSTEELAQSYWQKYGHISTDRGQTNRSADTMILTNTAIAEWYWQEKSM